MDHRPSPSVHRSSVLTVVVALLLALAPSVHAAASPDLEAAFVARANDERAAAGLPALSVAGDLTEVGRRHAARMADGDHLHHNPNLGGDVGGWQKVGENVGRGPEADRIHAAFMDSPSHRDNILDPEWTEIGIGVVVDDGTVWVTQLFRLPSGASPPQEESPAESEEEQGQEPEPEADTPDPAPDDADEADQATDPDDPAEGDADDPAEDEPSDEAAPEPREVTEVPPGTDRVAAVLARLEVADRDAAGRRPVVPPRSAS